MIKGNYVFIYVHFVILQKAPKLGMDYIVCHPKPFYKTYRMARNTRRTLIENGSLSEENSKSEDFKFLPSILIKV
jgi:Pyruvate/2-oxoacid:ferredoxin oxidoreductase gamma subunit